MVMSDGPSRTEHQFDRVGGRLCLDFANTVSGVRGGALRERLDDYASLVSWGRQAGVVTEAQARRLLAEARRRPPEAEAVLREARELREAVYSVFLAFVEKRDPRQPDLDRIGAALGRALAHRRIRRRERPARGAAPDAEADEGSCCALSWEEAPGALDAVLWPVVASAAELLVSGSDLARVRICGLYETNECGWLFVDETKSRTRRWCSMKDCGNRAKARRHYSRAKAGG